MKRVVTVLALAAAVLTPAASLAQSDLGLKKLGVSVGFVNPENLDGTATFGVFADHGTIAPRFGLESHIGYWSCSERVYTTETSVSDVAFGARTKYYIESETKMQPFVGGGLGLHFVHAEVVIPAQFGFPEMRTEDSSTKLGLDLGGGITTPLGARTDLNAELWYGIIPDVSQFSMRVGLAYRLNQ
jgi:opacity protein-like surface antigen